MNIRSVICFIIICFVSLSYYKVEGKQNKSKTIMCADTDGLRLEFSIPTFNYKNKETIFSLKFYKIKDRESFLNLKGRIIKKKRQKNSNYYFYDAFFYTTKDMSKKINFRFYPPSTLMIDDVASAQKTLACW